MNTVVHVQAKKHATDKSKTNPFLVIAKNSNEWHVGQNTHWSKLLKFSPAKQHKNMSQPEQNR